MITVVGSMNIDLVVETDHFPEQGETTIGNSFEVFTGGKGANQAVAVARLGKETQFISACGTDAYGELALSSLKKENLNIENVFQISDVSTGITSIIVNNSDNRIIYVPGANYHITPEKIESVKEQILKSEMVILQLEIPPETVQAVLELCKEHQIPTILNPAPIDKFKEEFIDLATYITPNETECASMFGDNMEAALERYPNKLIVTLGDEGARYYDGEKHVFVESYPVKAVDTTGAGDTFNGSLAVALTEGKSVEEAVRFANASASLSVEKKGAQSGMPTYDMVLKRLG